MIKLKSLLREAVDLKNLYIGYVLPSFEVKAIRADSFGPNASHEDLLNTEREINASVSASWRYRKDLNTVYWWKPMPNDDIKDSFEYWLNKKLGMLKPTHKMLDPMDLVQVVQRGSTYNQAHGEVPL